MSTQTITYKRILEMIQGIAQQQKETAEQMKETDRKFQETREQMKETDRKMKETDRKISALGSRVGEIVEHMIGGDTILMQFQALGYDVTEYSRNVVFGKRGTTDSGQIDMLLDDGNVAILIEVKTNLQHDDVLDHIERLEKYSRRKHDKGSGKKRYIGALACAIVADNVVKFAQKQGMYVILQQGNDVEILAPPAGFKVKEW